MTDLNPDQIVRPKYAHLLLDASYFPFLDLPVELALRILVLATAASQGTYRSLLLTNKRISDSIRIDLLHYVPVILTTGRQLEAFKVFLEQRPEVIPHIHALWTISPGSVHHIIRTCVAIVNTCTSLRSLACHPQVLHESICRAPFVHTRCVDLTLIEFRGTWNTFMHSTSGPTFFNALERMHFIGALDQNLWSQWAVIPSLQKLKRASIAMGSHRVVFSTLFAQLIQSPKLEQVVITTRLHGEDQQMLSDAAVAIDDRFSVMHRRRRWKESNLWVESLHDQDRFWNQAKAEKYLPPAPRPASTGTRV